MISVQLFKSSPPPLCYQGAGGLVLGLRSRHVDRYLVVGV
jgi:hypothetical protein